MANGPTNYDGQNGIYPERTDNDHASILAAFMPTGKHMVAKRIESSNMFKLLRGWSKTFKRLEEKINESINGRVLTESVAQLENWENVAGVPDECYKELGTIDNRQTYTIAKLSSDGVSTAEDLEWICSLFGYDVTVYPGHSFWPNGTDYRVSFSSEKESRFTIVFEIDNDSSVVQSGFPYTFPFIFGEDMRGTMQCLITSLIDSNVNGLWINKAPDIWISVPDGTAEAITSNPSNGDEIVSVPE